MARESTKKIGKAPKVADFLDTKIAPRKTVKTKRAYKARKAKTSDATVTLALKGVSVQISRALLVKKLFTDLQA